MSRSYAILGGNLVHWQGGRWFLRLILRAMAVRSRGSADRIVLVLPSRSAMAAAMQLAGWGRHALWRAGQLQLPPPLRFEAAPRDAVEAIASGIDGPLEVARCTTRESSLVATLKRTGADVLLLSSWAWSDAFPIPWVGYIPDLQHRYLPQGFSPGEIARRDAGIAAMLRQAHSVVVNSRSVKDDLMRHFPGGRARIFELPFAPLLEEGAGGAPDPEVMRRHGIHDPFFLVSNQFWIHKNHKTAFHALRRLMDSTGRNDVQLVCTGATEDYRSRTYFPGLIADLQRLGIRDRVRILGLIPRGEQLALMTQASALVQPTLFEGGPGGGAVYDAVSLGVRVLVSDIPVNREIDDDDIDFFPPEDAGRLAVLMEKTLLKARVRPDRNVLSQRSVRRAERFAERLVEAADHAVAGRSRQGRQRT
jgi:glycosyltransferase involved in cell wall biosynthesis